MKNRRQERRTKRKDDTRDILPAYIYSWIKGYYIFRQNNVIRIHFRDKNVERGRTLRKSFIHFNIGRRFDKKKLPTFVLSLLMLTS